ncbi:unnamed protein product [Paramecium pentaurelia]|uniref:Uncharacterized protein n=1 Tax=Paramecium pentaurelia TaxID=43138 RepID=A0A8S1WC92_9CILI|nr:unnamed protein product [Paramecium pentaurelia]
MQELIEISLKKVLPGILFNQIAFYSLKILKNNEVNIFTHIVAGSIYTYHFDQHILRTNFVFYYRILRGFRDPRYEVIFDEYKKETFKRDVAVLDNIFSKDSLYLQLVLLCISYLRINQILYLWQFLEHLLNGYILKDQLIINYNKLRIKRLKFQILYFRKVYGKRADIQIYLLTQ